MLSLFLEKEQKRPTNDVNGQKVNGRRRGRWQDGLVPLAVLEGQAFDGHPFNLGEPLVDLLELGVLHVHQIFDNWPCYQEYFTDRQSGRGYKAILRP